MLIAENSCTFLFWLLWCSTQAYDLDHGLLNYIDTKAKCRHLKNGPVKGVCSRCLSEFIDWRYSRSCWYFRPSFVNCCTYNLLSGSTLPPPPLPCVKVQYILHIQCVAGRGWGCWVLLETIFCRSSTHCISLDSESTELLDHSKHKPRRGGGLRKISTCRKANFQRWKSQRKKIHRLAYRFSIDLQIYRLAYGFLCVNHKGLAKVYRFLVRAFFSQDFKNP